ncbi:MAG: phosphotransferase [Clostridia bacterium]|nr:phosphotransferase [Clostridia bacterium]
MNMERLCACLGLGDMLAEPIPLQGGFLHRMMRLTTTCGDYAVKCLNPYVMSRPTAAANFAAAEKLERQLEQTDLPLLPALTFNGQKMQTVDGRYYYLFDYYPGVALTDGDITPAHCRRIGSLLATIHNMERRTAPCQREAVNTDWDACVRLSAQHPALQALLNEHREMLDTLQNRANAALPHLPMEQAICHNDMDPKNVLWQGEDCRIIDLECLSYDSPYLELLETALCWAGYETGHADPHRLTAFLDGYRATGGRLPTDWQVLYDTNAGRLEWLAYNVNRALGIACDPDETALGMTEVCKTLTCLRRYHRHRDAILTLLET